MPRFFVQASSIHDGVVRLFGSDASHISRSLRMRPGEEIVVCDMQRREYRCVLERFTADEVYARVVSESASETEPPYRITVYQALAKSDKMDYIVQKSVEAGAFAVVPFEGERCVARELSDNGAYVHTVSTFLIYFQDAGTDGRIDDLLESRDHLSRSAHADLDRAPAHL